MERPAFFPGNLVSTNWKTSQCSCNEFPTFIFKFSAYSHSFENGYVTTSLHAVSQITIHTRTRIHTQAQHARERSVFIWMWNNKYLVLLWTNWKRYNRFFSSLIRLLNDSVRNISFYHSWLSSPHAHCFRLLAILFQCNRLLLTALSDTNIALNSSLFIAFFILWCSTIFFVLLLKCFSLKVSIVCCSQHTLSSKYIEIEHIYIYTHVHTQTRLKKAHILYAKMCVCCTWLNIWLFYAW